MTSVAMSISLSTAAADARWGEKAILSSSDKGLTVHLTHTDSLAVIQRAARKIDTMGIRQVVLRGAEWDLEKSWAFWLGYSNPKGAGDIEWPQLDGNQRKELDDRLKIVGWVRSTINLPANVLTPSKLTRSAVDLLKEVGDEAVSYRITKGEALREQNYMGIYMVGRSSPRRPALLALDYNPSGDENTPVYACLVGKGITFDTGGYSLKQTSFMESMKSDMGGAATVTGALALAIARGLQKRVRLYLCCAENMVSGNAFKPGDVIRFRNGKSVEVMNTDAEGRLVLADGLIDASAQVPELLIDAATLTGAAKTALGNDYHALFSFDDPLAQKLLESAQSENESFWRLPLEEFHRNHLPSGFSDLNNIASPLHSAGASTAAAFLSWFVKNYQKGWLHIDCSATYRKSAVEQWAAGATGLGVRTIANLLLK